MTNTQAYHHLSLILIIILLAGVNSQTLDNIKDEIVNNWKSIALELIPQTTATGVIPEYQRREFNFTTDLVFSILIENFADRQGSQRILSIKGSGSTTFQSESTVIAGAFQCQFTFDQSIVITLHTDDLVTFFNSVQTGGITWVKDQPQDVFKKDVPALQLKANENFIAYDIIYIKDDYLYMGDVDAFGNEASATQSSQGLCAPLIPFDSDVSALSVDELKSDIVSGVWQSLTKEVRPGFSNDGSLITLFMTRQITFPTDSSYNIVINRYPGPGQTDSIIEFETNGHLVWEGDASEVVQGAQFVQFVRDEFYVTPKNADIVTSFNTNLPDGINQFVLGQKANLTGVDFPALGLSKSVQYAENDLLYLRENRLFLGSRPVDGSRPNSVASRTYSLDDDLIDPERSLNLQIISITLLILALLN